ncbi:hypothetical protein FRB96_004770 [Tulasnella sp. 330]|nr:hypothetical protein FRB96_004770 [Tulasnella sp. 330]KAG8882408.1 hypothetical protein FRB97_008312 [Tulasnella sp. 331]KAG8888797.1 hypothetical protein FRB98_006809 [Tulasnella sp. 332]
MPGPSVNKQKSRQKHRSNKLKRVKKDEEDRAKHDEETRMHVPHEDPAPLQTTENAMDLEEVAHTVVIEHQEYTTIPAAPPTQTFLLDPGNGARVLDVLQFLESPFADPVCDTDERCFDFASPEVFPILQQVLPFQVALILWYNVTRKSSRICPSCRRTYRLGDHLPPHLHDMARGTGSDSTDHLLPQTAAEQRLSGICSWMCFALASYRYPGSIAAWGNSNMTMPEDLIEYMNGPGDPSVTDDEGLGQLLRMTRNEESLGIDDLRAVQRIAPLAQNTEIIYVSEHADEEEGEGESRGRSRRRQSF